MLHHTPHMGTHVTCRPPTFVTGPGGVGAGPLGAHGRCGHRHEGPAPEQSPGLPDSYVSPLLPDTWLALHQASSQHLETGLRKGPAECGQTEVRSQEGQEGCFNPSSYIYKPCPVLSTWTGEYCRSGGRLSHPTRRTAEKNEARRASLTLTSPHTSSYIQCRLWTSMSPILQTGMSITDVLPSKIKHLTAETCLAWHTELTASRRAA